MPLYEYSCEKCKVSTMAFRHIDHRYVVPKCDCGNPMTRMISRGVIGKVEKEYFHPGFGEVVRNKHHYRELQRKHGTRDMDGADYTAITDQLAGKVEKKETTAAEYQWAANNYGLKFDG